MSCLDLDSMIALNLFGLTIIELYSIQSIAKPDLNVNDDMSPDNVSATVDMVLSSAKL